MSDDIEKLRALMKRDEGDPKLTADEATEFAALSRRLLSPEANNMRRIDLGKAGLL